MTPLSRQAAQAERDRRRGLRADMAVWAEAALPQGQAPAAHHLLLIAALADVCSGATDRLMVLMPPGSAKSTYGSVLFVPFWFMHHPGSNVIACSHTASLAGHFGGRVRTLVQEHCGDLGYGLTGTRAAHDFALSHGGSYYAAGTHGAITGRRADLIVIDDPVRCHTDADSARCREHLWHWYRSDLLTRLKPGGRVVLIMTRWHEDDLGGRLLERDPSWRLLRLPALAEADDPLGRPPGAPLWPEWEDAAALERKRVQMGEREWAALYQQQPRAAGDTMLRASQIGLVDDAAPVVSVRAWDLAATEATEGRDPDWTVGVKLGRDASDRLVVLDVVRLRGSPYAVESAILQTAARDGHATQISLPKDPGQAGPYQTSYLTRQLAGYTVHASPEKGTKTQRATPVSCQIAAGNLAVLRGEWNRTFLDELREFPLGRKDDQVDALSRAFNTLAEAPKPGYRTGSNVTAR